MLQEQPPKQAQIPGISQQNAADVSATVNHADPTKRQQNFPRKFTDTLELKKIPRELNNIAKLNEHFQKFGTIKNIQVQ